MTFARMDLASPVVAAPPLPRTAYVALARRVRLLSWLSLAWMTVEGGVALAAGFSAATRGEGRQNMLCAHLAGALLVGLLANALVGAWWLDGAVGLLIAAVALKEGRDARRGDGCGCCASPLEGVLVVDDEDCHDACCR